MALTQPFYVLVFDEFNVPTADIFGPAGVNDVADDPLATPPVVGTKMTNIREYKLTIDCCGLSVDLGIDLLDKTIAKIFLGEGPALVGGLIPPNTLALYKAEVTDFDDRARIIVLLGKSFFSLDLAAGGTTQFMTATAVGALTVTDAALNVPTPGFEGLTLRRLSDNQERTITANTATQFTVDSAFSPAQAPGDEFEVIVTGDRPDAAAIGITIFDQGETGRPRTFIGDVTAAALKDTFVGGGGAAIAELCNFIAKKTVQDVSADLDGGRPVTIIDQDSVDAGGRTSLMIVFERNQGMVPPP